ncbi:MAG: VOC family protein [Chloroflexota bacterium]
MSDAFRIDEATRVTQVSLAVADLVKMSHFYQHVVGLRLDYETEETAVFSTNTSPILQLSSRPTGQQHPNAIGLFHFALLLPNRPALGQWLNHYEQRHALRSSADHLYSEAVYINDPEGNVVELYCDRPRHTWYDADGKVKMGTLPLDLESLRVSAEPAPFTHLPENTQLGHVHLQIHDVAECMQFYSKQLGLDNISMTESAGFVGAGGYHHHIGFNIFNSKNGKLPPKGSLGLISYTLRLPSKLAKRQLRKHLAKHNYPFIEHENGFCLSDPSGIQIVVTTEE